MSGLGYMGGTSEYYPTPYNLTHFCETFLMNQAVISCVAY